MKYSLDKKVSFDDKNHTYTRNNKKLLSVTTFINKFKNEFDSEYWSKKIAFRDNKTKEEVLKEWSYKAKKSCEIGTAIHKIFEDFVDNKYNTINGNLSFDFAELDSDYLIDFIPKSKIAIQFIQDFFISKRLIPVYSEYIVYNDFLAGQVDLICKDKDENYFILDFKTNDKIEVNNYGKYLKDKLKDIPDSTFYHYSLQLSIYKKMLNQKVKSIFLIHITKDNYKFIECVDIFKNFNLDFNSIIKI